MKKRSLLAATAMLLVAILAATGATYAWFSSAKTAYTNVNMSVSAGSSLEIRDITAGESGAWKTTVDITTGTWVDRSTNDTEFPTFYKALGMDTGNVPTGYATTDEIKKVTLQFRSPVSGDVSFLNSSISVEDAGNANLLNTLRVGITGKANKIFGNAEMNLTDAINGTATTNVTGTQTVNAISTKTAIVAMSQSEIDDGDSYFYGKADFYFWVEGTDCDNSMVKANETMGKVSFQFQQ